MGPKFTVGKEDWSLYRKGQTDQERHREKVREAIKRNLMDIVAEENIIVSDGRKVLKVPIRYLEEFRFRFNESRRRHVGQGDGRTGPGDLLGQEARGRGGRGAGDLPGVDYYEAEITVDELAELVCEDLGLPYLRPREPRLAREVPDFRDVRKKGLSGNLDRRRTLLEAFKRSAREGRKACRGLLPDDLRYRAWDVTVRPEARAVVLAMMDTSGSMGTFEKYVARSFFFWMVRFLRAQYQNVEVVFLAHHTEARETTEEEFFTRAESGGTRCSSVYRLALDLIGQRFPPQDYNIYVFHFSDGDNLVADNELCVRLVLRLLEVASMVGYAEIEGSYRSASSLRNAFKRIQHPRFVSVLIRDKTEVYQALRAFFGIHGE